MRATGVIVRFLSLLDVTLILLGVLMVALMHSQPRRPSTPENGPREIDKLGGFNLPTAFLYLYAGWRGDQDGRCFELDPATGKMGPGVRTDTDDDIGRISPGGAGLTRVVMLLFDEQGWYSGWDAKKLDEIEQAWKLKVVPVYNVGLPKDKGTSE